MNMRGVILAGGTGTRLRPLTSFINKHLLPVGRKPMIGHAITKMKEAGIRDVLIITGSESAGLFARLIGSGSAFGMRIAFRIQDEAGGIAQALGLASDFVGESGKFVALLADNLFEAPLTPYLRRFALQPAGALVLLKKVPDPFRYGVPVLNGDRIVRIEEKPEQPQSPYCVTGIYFYDGSVFRIAESLKPSRRGELEITDVNNVYAAQGLLRYEVLPGWWTDAGTFESLHEAGKRLIESGGDGH